MQKYIVSHMILFISASGNKIKNENQVIPEQGN